MVSIFCRTDTPWPRALVAHDYAVNLGLIFAHASSSSLEVLGRCFQLRCAAVFVKLPKLNAQRLSSVVQRRSVIERNSKQELPVLWFVPRLSVSKWSASGYSTVRTFRSQRGYARASDRPDTRDVQRTGSTFDAPAWFKVA
jgi:hypothetical protein